MSDDEFSEGMEELQELLAIYKSKEEEQPTPSFRSVKARHAAAAAEPKYVEVPMEKVIFGDKQKFISNLAKAVGQKQLESEDNDADADAAAAPKRKAAWSDSDDDDLQVGDVKKRTRHTGPLNHLRKDKSYKEYLEARFTRTVNQPKWATLEHEKQPGDSSDSDDEPLLKTVGFIDHKAKYRVLRPTSLHFKRVKDLNRTTYSEGVISSIQFHPTSTAALVAGESSVATIYSVDGQKNEKLHSIRFRNYPVTCARIAPCGTKAFFGGKKPFYYSYDLINASETKLNLPRDIRSFKRFELSPCGKYIALGGFYGAVHLFTTSSNELLHSFKQEGGVRGLCFTADSQRLLVSGCSSNISVMSLRQNNIEHSFLDDGCIRGQVVRLSPNQRLLASGSNEGVVNVYDYESVFLSRTPMPEKRFMHLRTAISDVQFNHSSELLAMCSNEAPNAVRLAHFPSSTVYANFPGTEGGNVGRVGTAAFSPHSGFLAFGNRQKKVPLYKLKHFRNY